MLMCGLHAEYFLKNVGGSVDLQVQKVGINSLELLVGLRDQLIQKVVLKPNCIGVYAKFARFLVKAMPNFSMVGPDGRSGMICLKKLLLNRLQDKFEVGMSEQVDEVGMREEQGHNERLEDAIVRRQTMVAYVKFMGELYNLSMLSERIIHECIKLLLQHMAVENIRTCLFIPLIFELDNSP